MKPLLECVPNFSEGKDHKVIEGLVAVMTAVPGATCLSHEKDGAHNRCVITMAGSPEAMAEAAFHGAAAAIDAIDIRNHVGEHKRMGAMDVCPFVPLGSADMKLAVKIAMQVGKRIGEELKVPVFLYAEAAQREARRVLGNVRNKQYEGLLDLVGLDPAYTPDFGPDKMHETAGAIGVGARTFLIAYNINLKTADVAIAKSIAKQVRERDGGLPRVQAMGFSLDDRNQAQVSMNLLDYNETGIGDVYAEVQAKAMVAGIEIDESEIVGLVPADALDEETAERVLLKNFDPAEQVVEEKLKAAGVI